MPYLAVCVCITDDHLCSVGQEDGRSQVASDATEDVND